MSQFLHAGINRGGAIVTANVAQVIAQPNPVRRGMTVQNTSDTDMFVSETGEDATPALSYKLVPGAACAINTDARVTIVCAASAKTFAATEF